MVSFASTSDPGASGSRQDQFLRYLRNTRLNDAFQKAMITLYKMPIKPTNITEFFAEYFDNGARNLIHASLLKAELCYKLSEKEDLREKISAIEIQIRKLQQKSVDEGYPGMNFEEASDDFMEDDNLLATTSGFPIERGEIGAVPEELGEADDDKFLIERFLGDVRETLTLENNAHAEAAAAAAAAAETRGEDDETLAAEYNEGEGQEETEEMNEEMEVDPVQEWKVMMAMLDPWGILVNKTKVHLPSMEEGQLPKSAYTQPTGTPPPTEVISESINLKFNEESQHTMETEVLSQITSAASTEYESDDAQTLAETYYNFATSVEHKLRTTRIFDSWGEEEKLSEKVEESGDMEFEREYTQKRYTSAKRSADKTQAGPRTFEELMGWTPLPCTNTDEISKSLSKDKERDGRKSQTLLYPKTNWSQFTELYKDMERDGEDEDDRDSCVMDMDFYKDVLWQDEAMNLFPSDLLDESFLLQCEKEDAADGEEEGFVFNLCKNFDQLDKKDREAICGKCKKKKKKTDGQTSTSELHAGPPCTCEDCECDPECGQEGRASLAFQGSQEDLSEAFTRQSGQQDLDEMEGEGANDPNRKGSGKDADNKNRQSRGSGNMEIEFGLGPEDGNMEMTSMSRRSEDDRKTSPPLKQKDDGRRSGRSSRGKSKAHSKDSGKMVEMTDSFKEFLDYMAKEGKSLAPLEKSSDQCQCDHDVRTPPSSPLFQEECDKYCETRRSGDQGRKSGERRATLDAELEESFKRSGFPAKMEEEEEADNKDNEAYVPIDGSKVKKDVYYYFAFAEKNFDDAIKDTFFGDNKEDAQAQAQEQGQRQSQEGQGQRKSQEGKGQRQSQEGQGQRQSQHKENPKPKTLAVGRARR